MLRQTVLDMYDDRGALLRQYPEEQVRSLLKTATAVTPELANDLDIGSFALVLRDADGYHRKYATVDRGNTGLSILYFLQTGHQLPPDVQKLAAANLCWAAEQFGLPVPDELQKLADGARSQLPIVDLTHRELPRFEKQAEGLGFHELKKVAERAPFDIWNICPRDRRAYAQQLMKAAEHTGIDVSNVALAYGGDDYGDSVEPAVRGRYAFLKDASAQHAYELLLANRPQLTAEKFAALLADLDEYSHIDHLWDAHVPDPYQTTFLRRRSTIEKQAREADMVEAHDLRVSRQALRKLASAGSPLEEVLDERLFAAFREDPVGTFHQASYPLQQIIAQHVG